MAAEIHPQVKAVLQAVEEAGIPKFQDLSPQAARDLIERLAEKRREDYPPPEVAAVPEVSETSAPSGS